MSPRPPAPARRLLAATHPTWTIVLHWGSVAAIVLATAAVLLREVVEETALRNLLMNLHRQAGLAVLLALAARLVVRARRGLADAAGDVPPLWRRAALLAHAALYLMLLVLPLLGWAASNAHGVTVRLFGLLPLPMLVGDDPDLADELTDMHLWASWALLALVLMHAAAAWWHHAVLRDGVLAAMWPWAGRRLGAAMARSGEGAAPTGSAPAPQEGRS